MNSRACLALPGKLGDKSRSLLLNNFLVLVLPPLVLGLVLWLVLGLVLWLVLRLDRQARWLAVRLVRLRRPCLKWVVRLQNGKPESSRNVALLSMFLPVRRLLLPLLRLRLM
jgi:hypothetical protein